MPLPQTELQTCVRSSSALPSQSLSLLSQISGEPALGVQRFGLPFIHDKTVFTHSPVPHVTVGRPSSIWPLQLLSRPSQLSRPARGASQAHSLLVHVFVPLHVPFSLVILHSSGWALTCEH